MCLHACMCSRPSVWVHKNICAWRSQKTSLVLQDLFFLFLRKVSPWPRWSLPGRLDWLAVNQDHHLRSLQVWDCKSRPLCLAFPHGFWWSKSDTQLSHFLSTCLFVFFFLEISNPFVYLKLTWWYRKSPDSLSPQWAWKFLYLTPWFTICWKRWNNTKALLLPRPVVYVGMDVLYIWHHPRICLQCSKTLLCSTCRPHLAFINHLLSLYFTVIVFIHIQNPAFNWFHLWCVIFL